MPRKRGRGSRPTLRELQVLRDQLKHYQGYAAKAEKARKEAEAKAAEYKRQLGREIRNLGAAVYGVSVAIDFVRMLPTREVQRLVLETLEGARKKATGYHNLISDSEVNTDTSGGIIVDLKQEGEPHEADRNRHGTH